MDISRSQKFNQAAAKVMSAVSMMKTMKIKHIETNELMMASFMRCCALLFEGCDEVESILEEVKGASK
jgi:hypothetical protein